MKMNIGPALLINLTFLIPTSAVLADAGETPTYVKYYECIGEQGAKLELYANPSSEASRASIAIL